MLAKAKVVDGQFFKAEVTEEAIEIEGYNKVAPVEKTIIIGVENNVINFYYTKRTDLSYTVKYLEAETEKQLADPKTVNGQTYGASVKETAIEIAGYNKVAPASQTITIEVENNVINFYYTKRDDLSYTVKYLEQGTEKKLAEPKTVDKQIFGAEVTEPAIDIIGYNKVTSDKTITIKVTGNEIIFYYVAKGKLIISAEAYKGVYDGKEHDSVKSLTVKDPNGNVLYVYDAEHPEKNMEEVKGLAVDYVNTKIKNVKDPKDIEIKVNYVGYNEQTVTVTPEITPASLTITTESASKTHNGTALTAPGKITGLVNNEEVPFKVTGTQTEIGQSTNTYKLDWESETATAKASNYTVIEKLGVLQVIKSDGTTVIIKPDPVPTVPDPGVDIPDENPPLIDVGDKLNKTDHFSYVVGNEKGLVQPDRHITRAEAASIFFHLMTDEFRAEHWTTESPFPDVPNGTWYTTAVATAAHAGILVGTPEGNFEPDKVVTRAQFAALAANFISDSVTDPGTGDFEDTVDHWAAKQIRLAVLAGWIHGVGGNKFDPDRPITLGEVTRLVNTALERYPDPDHMNTDPEQDEVAMVTWPDLDESHMFYADILEASNGHLYEYQEDGVTEQWTKILKPIDWVNWTPDKVGK